MNWKKGRFSAFDSRGFRLKEQSATRSVKKKWILVEFTFQVQRVRLTLHKYLGNNYLTLLFKQLKIFVIGVGNTFGKGKIIEYFVTKTNYFCHVILSNNAPL